MNKVGYELRIWGEADPDQLSQLEALIQEGLERFGLLGALQSKMETIVLRTPSKEEDRQKQEEKRKAEALELLIEARKLEIADQIWKGWPKDQGCVKCGQLIPYGGQSYMEWVITRNCPSCKGKAAGTVKYCRRCGKEKSFEQYVTEVRQRCQKQRVYPPGDFDNSWNHWAICEDCAKKKSPYYQYPRQVKAAYITDAKLQNLQAQIEDLDRKRK